MSPVNRVWKFHNGGWNEPGVNGNLTPTFRAQVAWQKANTNAFWGPSVNWTSYLETWVMLLNRSCCSPGWPQKGIYISYNADISDPAGWSAPRKILNDTGWYPQVIGTSKFPTDSTAGRVARLYIYGASRWELVFQKPAEVPVLPDPPPPPDAPPSAAPVFPARPRR
jgi:hypothetical protein